MSKWKQVGNWLKDNAGAGVGLVGSLLTGNVSGAIAKGVSLISSATGQTDPASILESLQTDPETVVKLKELAYQEERSIREHLEIMTKIEVEDAAKAHHETQETIRAGDKAESRFVKYTRPGQAWISLGAAIGYVFFAATVDVMVLGALLTLPFAYSGLRQMGKLSDNIKEIKKFK